MAIFAKLIDLEDGEQVLLTKGYNDDEERFELQIRTDVDGVGIDVSVGFNKEESQKEAFDNYGLENAKEFRAGILSNFF